MTYDSPVPLDVDEVPCRKDPERHFPTGTKPHTLSPQEKAAKTVCRTGNNGRACHMLDRCLRYSLRYAVEGIWAGTTFEERRAIRERTGVEAISITTSLVRQESARKAS